MTIGQGTSQIDERLRETLLPVRIVLTEGAAEGACRLTAACADQIGLNESDVTLIRGKGRIVLDFGRELHGGVRILAGAGTDGAKVRIRLGESVSESLSELGVKNSVNAHTLRDLTFPLPMFSDMELFCSGFRFVALDFLEGDALYVLKAVNAVSVCSKREQVGEFRSSDGLINRIFDTAAYTVRLCAQNYIWDGIKRDRLVWMGDLFPEVVSLLSVCKDDGCVEKSLDFVKAQTPLPGWMNNFPTYSMWWVIVLFEYYKLTGNAAYLTAQREYFEKLMLQIDGHIGDDGEFDFGTDFVDWPTHGHADESEGVRCLAKLCARAAGELEKFYGIGTGVAERILKKLSAKDSEVTEKKQIVALKYLSGTPVSAREKAILGEGGAKGFSTFMSYFLLSALSETQSVSDALSAMKEYYGGMLEMGATTFWEDFDVDWTRGNVCPVDRMPEDGELDIHGDFGKFCYLGYRHSLCHGWSAGVIYFLITRVLGVSVEGAGFGKVTVSPDLGDLEKVDAVIPTPHGELKLHCEKKNGKTVVHAEAPAGVEVTLAEGKNLKK